ncbi:MAG: anti-sigma factor [bacterium]
MDCPAIEKFDEYLARLLPSEERAAFERHIEECSSCQKLLVQERNLNRLLAQSLPQTAPPGFAELVQSKLVSRKYTKAVPDWLWALGLGLVVAVSCLLFGRAGSHFTEYLSKTISSYSENPSWLDRWSRLESLVPGDWWGQLSANISILGVNLVIAGVILCFALWQVYKTLRA